MNKKQGFSLLQAKKKSFANPQQKVNKQYGAQARIAAMHSIQRASGRRGN